MMYERSSGQERWLELGLRWLILAAAVWVAAEVVPGIYLEGWESTLAVALILGLLNMFLRPVLFIISLPVTILTLGLFLIVLNALLLLLADEIGAWFDLDFAVDGFGDALLGALIISSVNFVITRFVDAKRIARRLSRGS